MLGFYYLWLFPLIGTIVFTAFYFVVNLWWVDAEREKSARASKERELDREIQILNSMMGNKVNYFGIPFEEFENKLT